MVLRYNFILMIMFVLISGCASSGSRLPVISDSEAFKYEKEYLAEYESLKNNFLNPKIIKWVQPSNKKVPCKVYSGVSRNNDITLGENFKMFWDGDCRDGYAYGLGMEFLRDTVSNIDALAIYQRSSAEPQYFILKFNLDNRTQEGDINNGYYVETIITDEKFNFNINYVSGFMGSPSQPFRLVTYSSPFEDNIVYQKQYPNFAYELFDFSNNEFEDRKFQFGMHDKNNTQQGFGFTTLKSGQIGSGETINGKAIRRVQLPDSYFTNIGQILNEVTQATQKAKDAQKKALRVKKQYINKICKDSVYVTFIDNSEYKAICNEGEDIINLKDKIENKFAQINLQKQQKREQLRQQQQLNAQRQQQQQQQQQQQAALNDFANSMLELGNTARQAGSQALQNSNSLSYPSVTPLNTNPLNRTKIKTCYTVSGIEFCR